MSFNAHFHECAFSFVCPLRHLSECVLAILDSLVPASFNLFCCPVFVLSCTVYVGVWGSIPLASFHTGVLPRFAVTRTTL